MRKLFPKLIAPFALTFFIPLFCSADTSQPVFHIGVIAPLTGPAAAWGDHLQKSAILAKESLPPELRSRIELIFEDNQMKPANSVAAFRKLTTASNPVSALIVFSSPAAGAVVPLAENEKIPTIVLTAANKFTLGRSYSFRHFPGSEAQANVLVEEALRRRFDKIAVVATTHESALDAVEKFVHHPRAAGLQLEPSQEFAPGETDFRTAITILRGRHPNAILVVLMPPSLSVFLRQLRESGLSTPCFGFSNIENSSEITAAGSAAEGIFFSGAHLTAEFVAAYEKKYGTYPEIPSGDSYDTVLLIAEAIKSGVRNRDELNSFLHQVKDFKGAMGSYGVTVQNDFAVSAELKVVKDGKFQRAAE